MGERSEDRAFVSEAIEPGGTFVDSAALSSGEPPLPASFQWRDSELAVRRVVRTWRSTKLDRGDAYLARHWFEVETGDGRIAVLYFDRKARAGSARWWLYTIERDVRLP
jgi:uncharacterized protein DUF6504